MAVLMLVTVFSMQISVGAVKGSDYTSNKYVASRIDAILDEFPVGSYFSNTGKACRCHSSGCRYDNGCNCISVYHDPETGNDIKLKSVQCMGFARYCFYKIFGFTDRDNSNYYSVGSLSSKNMTVSNVKALIKKAKTGAHIRAKYNHSMILLEYDDSGLTVLHSNSTGRCQVSIYTMTWSKFVSLYKSSGVDYVNMPKTYPSSNKENPGSSEDESSEPEVSEPISSEPESSSDSNVQPPEVSSDISNDPDAGNDIEDILMGDVNGDGVVNTSDSLLVLRYSINMIEDEDIIVEAADVDDDGTITSGDSLLILKHSVGMIDLEE